MRIIIMASGSGSNFAAIYQAIKTKQIPVEFCTLIVDKPDAYAINRAKTLGANYHVVDFKKYQTKVDYEQTILDILNKYQPDLICLAGYMKIVGATILNQYEGKIINIHPSLLPKFPGKTALDDALLAGEKEIGITTHYVDSGVDTGQIIKQTKFAIGEMTREQIEQKLHKLEHQLYIETIKGLI